MSLFQVSFFSKVLGKATMLSVIIPESDSREYAPIDRSIKHKTLYLLHGGTDDYSAWMRQTAIERYAKEYKIAVVMPDADLSYYTDMVQGRKYWTFISEEVPDFVRAHFPLSEKKEDNFVAGLSMGGYGSFKLALRKPEMFNAAASFSGCLCMDDMINYVPHREKEFKEIFGSLDVIKNSENDLRFLAEKAVKEGMDLPRLYQSCGTEDFLYKMNIEFKEFAEKNGLKVTYEEGKGSHEWSYWDRCIQRALEFFEIKK